MNSSIQRFSSFGTISLKQVALHVIPVLAIGLAAASQATATATCSTSSLSLVSSALLSGSGGSIGCATNSTPGLTLYTSGPINSVLSESNIPTFAATWTVAYSGPSPATTTVAYDVILAGTSGQPITWALEAEPPGSGFTPIAGGLITIGLSGSNEYSGSVAGPVVAGNYTFELTATSTLGSSFSVNAPANSSIDIANPTPNGTVPEPASLATLGIGLAAGFLFFGKLRKKNQN